MIRENTERPRVEWLTLLQSRVRISYMAVPTSSSATVRWMPETFLTGPRSPPSGVTSLERRPADPSARIARLFSQTTKGYANLWVSHRLIPHHLRQPAAGTFAPCQVRLPLVLP